MNGWLDGRMSPRLHTPMYHLPELQGKPEGAPVQQSREVRGVEEMSEEGTWRLRDCGKGWVSRPIQLLSDAIHEFVVILVGTDPKPDNIFILTPRNGSVMETDINRPDISFRGKAQGWMERI